MSIYKLWCRFNNAANYQPPLEDQQIYTKILDTKYPLEIHGQGMQSDCPKRVRSSHTLGSEDETSTSRISLIVPKTLVKKVKDALEANGTLDKNVKIRPARVEEQRHRVVGPPIEVRPDAFVVPTKLSVGREQSDSNPLRLNRGFLQLLGLKEYEEDIDVITFGQLDNNHGLLGSENGRKVGPNDHKSSASLSEISSMNPLARSVDHWLRQLPPDEPNRPFARDDILSYSWTYMIYPPLLLLPPSILSNLSSVFASKGQRLPEELINLWSLLSKEFKISHIALNAPIMASTSKEILGQGEGQPGANILRSPTDLSPLYGDFGPALPLTHVPTVTDFSSAFWCTARQNGILQTWAPRYTMFSRGNISEKARLLSLETLTKKHLGCHPEETSAVDLYAGIGYFAFSYAKTGVAKVLCWEINPWSIEGLRRGAKRNAWGVKLIKDGQSFDETSNASERLVVFHESNEHAARRIAIMKDSIPPVRHVNCGLLPSSKDSWEVAVQVLDPIGGWIHAHENIAKADIESRKEEVVEIFERLVRKRWGQELRVQWEVKCEHVEQVKSYAPGVIHCVLDIAVYRAG